MFCCVDVSVCVLSHYFWGGSSSSQPYLSAAKSRVVIRENGEPANDETPLPILSDLRKAETLSQRGRTTEALKIVNGYLDDATLAVDMTASLLLIKFHTTFNKDDLSESFLILDRLQELDSNEDLWSHVTFQKKLLMQSWYYRRGTGTCTLADMMSLELEKVPKPDRTKNHHDDWSHIDSFNSKITAITKQLEKCIAFTGTPQHYKRWLFWNYYNHEFDLEVGTPVCHHELESLLDLMSGWSIEDAELITKASTVYRFCGRPDAAIGLLQRSLSFMSTIHRDPKKRQLYRKYVLEGIVQLALSYLQTGRVQDAIGICEDFKSRIASCTDVLVNAYSVSDQFQKAVLTLHEREVFKQKQNDTNPPDGEQLLASVGNQWQWGVGTRSAELFNTHLAAISDLNTSEGVPPPMNPEPLLKFAAPEGDGGWSGLRNEKLYTTRCNIERVHVDSLSIEAWTRDYARCLLDCPTMCSHCTVMTMRTTTFRFNRPVILQGAMAKWPNVWKWRRSELLERFGNTTHLRVRRGSDIAADNIATHGHRLSKTAVEIRRAAQHIPLRDYIEEHMPVNRHVNINQRDPMYVVNVMCDSVANLDLCQPLK